MAEKQVVPYRRNSWLFYSHANELNGRWEYTHGFWAVMFNLAVWLGERHHRLIAVFTFTVPGKLGAKMFMRNGRFYATDFIGKAALVLHRIFYPPEGKMFGWRIIFYPAACLWGLANAMSRNNRIPMVRP